MARQPRFNIGDTVYTKVSVRGSFEPSFCHVGEKMEVLKVENYGDGYIYTCSYDGYRLKEDQLMTKEEYIATL